MSNYIAHKLQFEMLKDCKLTIDGKVYTWNENVDPCYQNDGVLNISYYPLVDEDGEPTQMILAFDKNENAEDPQEWSDEYDANNPYVIEFR